jgi:hypothetical protein
VQVEILAFLRFLKVTKVQGMFREDSGKVQRQILKVPEGA